MTFTPHSKTKILMHHTTDSDGQYLWPGYDENSRILKWIFQRISNMGKVVKTCIGYVPPVSGIDLRGLDISLENVKKGLTVDKNEVKQELLSIREYYLTLGQNILPQGLNDEIDAILKEL